MHITLKVQLCLPHRGCVLRPQSDSFGIALLSICISRAGENNPGGTQPRQNSSPAAQQEGGILEQPMPGVKILSAVLKVKKLSFDQSGTTVTMATLRYSKNKKKKKKPPQTQRNQNKLPNHLHLASMLIYLKQASFIRGTQH